MGIFFSQVFRLLCFILLLAHIVCQRTSPSSLLSPVHPPSPAPPLLSPVQPPSPTPPLLSPVQPPSPTPPLLSPVQPPSPTPPHPTVQPYRPPSPSRHSDSGRFADMPRAPPDFVYRKPGSGRP